ncbi:MAG: serine hydrolase domain-containing protein [Bacteroidota bacterium]
MALPAMASSQSLYFPPLTGSQWDTVSTQSLGWCRPPLDSLLDYLGQNNTKAFILLKDGKIALERYYGTFTVDSAWYWASAGKGLTAFLTGIAKQEGLIDLNDSTSKYLGTGWTSCTAQQEGRIKVIHQLTMTTGLDDGVADVYCTDDTCLRYLADPGTRWAYHNGPYTLLDGVLQTATGRTINQYFNQKVSVFTGITGAYFPSGYNNVFVSKPRSMARFGLLMLNRGIWNNTTVLSDTTYFRSMINTSQQLNRSYGYLWWLNGKSSFMVPYSQFVFGGSWSPNAPPDMYAALGKNSQLLNVVPSMNLVFVRMGEDALTADVSFLLNDTIWQYLNRAFCTPTGIHEDDLLQQLTLCDGSSEELLVLNGPCPGLLNVRMYDLTGRLLLDCQADRLPMFIDNSKLGKGLIILQVSDGFRQSVRKFMID